jgi:hypothetical protein
MKRKMERVRSGKNPPPITKPGTARLPEQTRKARADQAWQTALTAKSRPQRDDALATWARAGGLHLARTQPDATSDDVASQRPFGGQKET